MRGNDEKNLYYPDIDDGFRGIAFAEACLKSDTQGNIWVTCRK